jgi:glutamyl-tRNA synthetase
LSKRNGAVSVMQYQDAGYLPEAMVNYLARLGWSHGDDELFSRDKLVEWFDGAHLAKSPAQWDAAKLNWVNAQYIKAMPDDVAGQTGGGPDGAAAVWWPMTAA